MNSAQQGPSDGLIAARRVSGATPQDVHRAATVVPMMLSTLPRQPQLVRMPDTSHFFHRKLMDLRGALKNGVRTWLPDPAA